MLDNPQHDFLTTELDPDLLSTPFRVQTNWHVITGAACSGKTTLIDLLAAKGFQTESETARQYIEREMARGRILDEIFESEADERGMKDLQLKIEHGLRAIDVAFLDRAFPDSLTYRRLAGLNPNEILAECFHHRYASVFVLDRLPFLQNGARIEDDVIAGQAVATEEGIAYEVAAATEDEVAYEAGVATEEGAAVVDAYAEVEGEAEQKEV